MNCNSNPMGLFFVTPVDDLPKSSARSALPKQDDGGEHLERSLAGSH